MKKEHVHHNSSHTYSSMTEFINENHRPMLFVFLGIGLLMFCLNVTAMLSYLPVNYSYLAFNFSSFGSILIILISTYYLTESSLEK